MTIYVAASAVRIQHWLIRTPELKLMRGASAALSTVTSGAAVREVLGSWSWGEAVRVEESAGEVDGVVVVRIDGQLSGEQVAHRLLDHLAGQLPGLDWEAWWCDAASYTEAYSTFSEGRASRIATLAPLLEATLVQTCRGCRAEVATCGQLGADCLKRGEHRRPDDDRFALPGREPRDFAELARVGGLPATSTALGRNRSNNHLATIVADGNRIGHIFGELRRLGDDSLNSQTVHGLNESTKWAVTRALAKVGPSAEVHAGIVHFVGGDDVFVSVPAREAWQFATLLATEFETKMKNLLDGPAIGTPSLGIGMVFSDTNYPIADSHAIATEALKQAKKHTRGRESAVVWADLTAESHPPRDRWVLLRELRGDLAPETKRSQEAQKRIAVMTLPPSARASLANLLSTALDPAPQAVRWAQRTGNRLDPWLGSKDPAVAADAVARTRDLLSRARWWPNPSPEGTTR